MKNRNPAAAVAITSLSLCCGLAQRASAQVPAATGATGLSPVAYYHLRQRADDARRAKRYAQAESLYVALTTAYPKNPDVWEYLASAQSSLGKRKDALRTWQLAWNAGSWPKGEVAYIIAQLDARLGKNAQALDWLDSALAYRLEDRPRMQTDSAFASLRSDARFRHQAGILPQGITRDAGWRYDITYFVEEAQRTTVALERPALSAAFMNAARTLSRDVGRLSDTQLAFGLYKLARVLGDGHSYLVGALPSAPVQLYQFSDGMFVINGSGPGKDLVGSRVERLGDVTADSAMRLISAAAPQDNEMTPLWLGIRLLSSPRALYALGISNDSTHLTMRVTDTKGAAHTISLATEESSFPRILQAPATVSSGVAPLWLTRASEQHWLTTLPELHAVYAQYNLVRDRPGETVAQFARAVSLSLASSGSTNLIVDVRHNSGGRRTLNTPLLVAMAAFKQASPNHEVYIITGRGTFSAAQVFISQAEWMVNPVYVGEPSSSRPNFVGEETGIILPYSKMRGSASSQYHQGTTYQDTRPFIPPDIPVSLSAADYFANRDPVMDALGVLLRAPRSSASPGR